MTHEDIQKRAKQQRLKNMKLQQEGKAQKVYNLLDEHEDANGEKYTECETCGKVFEQILREGIDTYTNFTNCPKCRGAVRKKPVQPKKIEEAVRVSTLKYSPFPWQKQFHEDCKKYRKLVLCAGARCATKGAVVNGSGKFIENVVVGDTCIDSYGCLEKITDVKQLQYSGNVFTVKAKGLMPYDCTEDHAFEVGRKINGSIQSDYLTCNELKELYDNGAFVGNPHYLKVPRIKGTIQTESLICQTAERSSVEQLEQIPFSEDIMWLFGMYTANGCVVNKQLFQITVNANNTDIVTKVVSLLESLDLHVTHFKDKTSDAYQIRVSRVGFAKTILDFLGTGAISKHIPNDILYHKRDNYLVAYLNGYYNGDGYYNPKYQSMESSTISKRLASDLQLAWARLGIYITLSSSQRNRTRKRKDGTEKQDSVIYRTSIFNADALLLLGIKKEQPIKRSSARVTDNELWVPIRTVTAKMKTTTVYSISTEMENFAINGNICHNCGKNRACNMQIIMDWRDLLNENRHLTQPDLVPSILGWIVAPNEKMADQNWRELKAFFPKSWVVGISESTKTIQTIGGGIIEVRSAYNPEDLVAVGLDLVSVTEAARVKYLEEVSSNLEDRLQSPGRGIGGKGGRFMLDSSPLGKNFFYKMWCWGQENHPSHADAPDWKSYQIPTTGNPKMAARYAEEYKLKDGTIITYGESLRRRKGRRFDQDNMAMFLDRGGVVFPEFRAKCVIDIYAESKGKLTKEEIKEKRKEWRMPLPQSMYRVGYDPAKGSSGDTPAIVVRDMLTNNIVWVEDLYGKIDDAQLDAVAFCAKKYNNAEICLLTAGDLLAAGQLRKRGCVVTELGEQGQNKRLFVQGLQYVISNEDVHILDDGDATTETLIFEIEDYTEDPVTGKFGNQTLPNDDFVSALYACFYDYHSIPDVKTQYSSKMKGVRGNVPRMQALRRGRR